MRTNREKKSWSTPRLTVYGNVEEITQSATCPGAADQTVYAGQLTDGKICGS